MSENDQIREDLRSLIDRFGRAGWIGRSIITPNPCNIEFTALGNQRMIELDAYDREVKATGLKPSAQTQSALHDVLIELGLPRMSTTEIKTLLSLAEKHHNDRAGA